MNDDLVGEFRALADALREHNQRVREHIEALEARDGDVRYVPYRESVDWESTLADIRDLPEEPHAPA